MNTPVFSAAGRLIWVSSFNLFALYALLSDSACWLLLFLVPLHDPCYVSSSHAYGLGFRFVRGDQYAIALALLDEGNVMLGVLACPNLPLPTAGQSHQHSLQSQVGCLFSARVGAGTYMEFLDGSSPMKVDTFIV